MRRPTALLRADAKRVSRDPMMLFLALMPPALAAGIGIARPRIAERLGAAFDLVVVGDVITCFLLLLTPMLFGFVVGLMLLDERDEGVLTVVALTPTGKTAFLVYRMALPVLWSAIMTVAVTRMAGFSDLSASRLAGLSALAGLQAPMIALFLAAFAADKVQGMALAKVGNVLAALGALAVLLPWPWEAIGFVSPHYWLVRLAVGGRVAAGTGADVALDGGVGLGAGAGDAAWAAAFALAVVVHVGVLALLARTFRRRIG